MILTQPMDARDVPEYDGLTRDIPGARELIHGREGLAPAFLLAATLATAPLAISLANTLCRDTLFHLLRRNILIFFGLPFHPTKEEQGMVDLIFKHPAAQNYWAAYHSYCRGKGWDGQATFLADVLGELKPLDAGDVHNEVPASAIPLNVIIHDSLTGERMIRPVLRVVNDGKQVFLCVNAAKLSPGANP